MDAGHRDDEDRLLGATATAGSISTAAMPPHELHLHPYHNLNHDRNPPSLALSHLHTHGQLPPDLRPEYSHDRFAINPDLRQPNLALRTYPDPAFTDHYPDEQSPSPSPSPGNTATATAAGSHTDSSDPGGRPLADLTAANAFFHRRGSSPYPDQASASSESDYMATSSTAASRAREQSYANATPGGPKHPLAPADPRNGIRTATRSVSAPIDQHDTSKLSRATRQPSVKDLTKRFDDHATTAVPRIPVRTGIPARQNRSATSGDRSSPATTTNSPSSYAALRTSVDRSLHADPSRSASGTRSSQRQRYFAEDQASNNPQSFASRISKPRNSVSTSKSMTQLAPNASPVPPPIPAFSPVAPSPSSGHGLLFGEIRPEQGDTQMAGHGIGRPSSRPRRTSESSVHPGRQVLHQRTLSDPEMLEPSSPSDWYRAENKVHPGQLVYQSLHIVNTPSGQGPAPQVSPADASRKYTQGPTDRQQGPPITSRLPLSVRKLASPSPSTISSPSGGNSRANSPSDMKPPNGYASNANTIRAKTPTRRAPVPRGLVTPNDGSHLNPFGAAPAPKLSPPLRSSRPRQSVAAATTTSSRMRKAEGTRSPRSGPSRNASKAPDPTGRRKIAVGPIDFEQRREHIRLAYTKSIRNTQAQKAQREAAERRKKELEAALRAKSAALAAARARAEAAAGARPPSTTKAAPTREPLRITTVPPINTAVPAVTSIAKDSPTLGIPGSFPDATPPVGSDDPPASALSMATEVTEFDDEPQTSAAVPPELDGPTHGLGVQMPGTLPEQTPEQTESPSYFPGPDLDDQNDPHSGVGDQGGNQTVTDDRVSIQISLDQEPTESSPQLPPQPELSNGDSVESLAPSGYSDEYEPLPYASPSLETTVRILRRESDQDTTQQQPSLSSSMYDYEDPEYQIQLDRSEARAIRRFTGQDDSIRSSSRTRRGEHAKPDTGSIIDRPRGDYLSPHRLSAGDSDSENQLRGYGSQGQTPDTSHSLVVPHLPSPANRNSHHSTWTDFSIDSNNVSDWGTGSRNFMDDETVPPTHPRLTIGSQSYPSPSGSSSERQSGHFSADMSPVGFGDGTASTHGAESQLPDQDASRGFSTQYTSRHENRIDSHDVPLPDYEPPPVPTPYATSISESYRPPSSTYQPDTRPGSTLVGSRRESEDFAPAASTPQSADHLPLEAREASLGGQTAVDSDQKSLPTAGSSTHLDAAEKKERHRLQQRRNVIKELVDTEMVFVRDMNIVEEIYKGTAEACPKLDDKTIKLIFRNVDEIVMFHTKFCARLKEAVVAVYAPQGRRDDASTKSDSTSPSPLPQHSDPNDTNDRSVLIGPLFQQYMEKMKSAHEGFLRNSDHAAKRLIQIQQDPTVMVWLNECHEVAKDLTAAWDLDSLLIKPMQRITKYPNLIVTLLQHTPQDHPDRAALMSAKDVLETAIIDINKTKKNFELVGQIVGRKRKESDVKAGFARAFGKRVDKLQTPSTRIAEDAIYSKLHEKFGDDYLRLQVVLRDVEFYTRQISAYVHEFLKYLSSMELVMRLQPGSYPELESKWVQFNVSMRDIEKVALDQHLSQVRKHVIEPFEHVIKAYGNPSLAMKKREKRRLDYERAEHLRRGGKTLDPKLKELVEQYDALNETLKKELPQLSALTEKLGVICLGNFVNIQASWWAMWKDKVKYVLGDSTPTPELAEIMSTFQRDFKFAQEQVLSIGLLNPTYRGRASQSTVTTRASTDDGARARPRPPELSPRVRGRSVNNDMAPVLPTPDFARRNSGQFTLSPSTSMPSPHQYYYRDYYAGYGSGLRPGGPSSGVDTPATGEASPTARTGGPILPRPESGRSFDSGIAPRQSSEQMQRYTRESVTSAYSSGYPAPEPRRYSGLFQSALPMDNEESQRPSRASSHERPAGNDYNVLWLAASLFEFNIETTKHEAGYAYLTYQAGEIFDVVAEKGELWLAKNQDDPREQVGWIWSKHFAKLADA